MCGSYVMLCRNCLQTKPDRHLICLYRISLLYLLNTKPYTAQPINPTPTLLLPYTAYRKPSTPIVSMSITQIFTVFAGLLALAGAYLYFFGIDPETKRALEKKALQTMGENKLSYMTKCMFSLPQNLSFQS